MKCIINKVFFFFFHIKQVMFKDERFRSSIETSDEEKLMPSQVLTVLSVSHMLAEDLQIEVMKVSAAYMF